MSEQYPGQPPGTGGLPPGYGGLPPNGQGFPPVPHLAQPPKSNRALVLVGVGCGGFLLLAIVAVVLGVMWVRSQASSTVSDLEKLGTAVSALPSVSLGSAVGPAKVLAGDCLLAYQCCRGIAAKSSSSAAAADACELFRTAGYPPSTCTVTLTGYRKTAELVGVRCE